MPSRPEPAGTTAPGALEDAQLRRPVGLERAVPVEWSGSRLSSTATSQASRGRPRAGRTRARTRPSPPPRPSRAACRRCPQPRRRGRQPGRSRRAAPPSSSCRCPGHADEVRVCRSSRLQPSSTSDHTGIPRSRASSTSGCSPGTPGDFTSSSTPSSRRDRPRSRPVDPTTSSPRLASARRGRAARAREPVDEHALTCGRMLG